MHYCFQIDQWWVYNSRRSDHVVLGWRSPVGYPGSVPAAGLWNGLAKLSG